MTPRCYVSRTHPRVTCPSSVQIPRPKRGTVNIRPNRSSTAPRLVTPNAQLAYTTPGIRTRIQNCYKLIEERIFSRLISQEKYCLISRARTRWNIKRRLRYLYDVGEKTKFFSQWSKPRFESLEIIQKRSYREG